MPVAENQEIDYTNLRVFLTKRDMKQYQLAELFGVSGGALSNYMRTGTIFPRLWRNRFRAKFSDLSKDEVDRILFGIND